MTELRTASLEQLALELLSRFNQAPKRLVDTEQEERYGDGLYIDPKNVYNSHGFVMVDAAVGLAQVQRLRNALDLEDDTHYTVWEVIETAAEQLERLKDSD